MDYNTHHFVLMHGTFITQLQKNEHTSHPIVSFLLKLLRKMRIGIKRNGK